HCKTSLTCLINRCIGTVHNSMKTGCGAAEEIDMLRAVLAVLAGGVGLGVAASGTASAAVAFDSFESDPLGGLDGRNGGSGWSGAWAVGSGRASAVNVVELSLS